MAGVAADFMAALLGDMVANPPARSQPGGPVALPPCPPAPYPAVMAPASPDLELQAVSKRFGHVVALDAVSLTIERGAVVTLLGPSGCGKTTTLRIVAGLEYQTAGSVRIRGVPVDGVPPYRRNANTVFQHYA